MDRRTAAGSWPRWPQEVAVVVVVTTPLRHPSCRLSTRTRAKSEVLINTLRFPLSIMRIFGEQWRRASGSDMLAVSLKGSLIGRIVATAGGELAFEEIEAFTLTAQELDEVLTGVRGLCEQGAEDLLVFFYPRDWRQGELIWTPDPRRIAHVQAKYLSASRMFSGTVEQLAAALHAQPQCRTRTSASRAAAKRCACPTRRLLVNCCWRSRTRCPDPCRTRRSSGGSSNAISASTRAGACAKFEQAIEAGQRERVAWLKARLRGAFDVAL